MDNILKHLNIEAKLKNKVMGSCRVLVSIFNYIYCNKIKIGLPIIKMLNYFYCILHKSEFKLIITLQRGILKPEGEIFKYYLKYTMYTIFKVFSQDRKSKIMNLRVKILIINHHHVINLQHSPEVTFVLMTI